MAPHSSLLAFENSMDRGAWWARVHGVSHTEIYKIEQLTDWAQTYAWSVQFSSVVSDSLRPHGSQHARPPVRYQLPEFSQIHVHRVIDKYCQNPFLFVVQFCLSTSKIWYLLLYDFTTKLCCPTFKLFVIQMTREIIFQWTSTFHCYIS